MRRRSFSIALLILLVPFGLLLLLNLRSSRAALFWLLKSWSHGGLLEELLNLLRDTARQVLKTAASPVMVAAYGTIVGIIILLENRNPDRTVAWLMVLAFVPLLGLGLYLLLGPRFASAKRLRQRHLITSRRRQRSQRPLVSSSDPGPGDGLDGASRLLSLVGESLPLGYRELLVTSDSSSAFGALFSAVEGAREFVHCEFFSISDDRTGQAFGELLKAKARQGVQVRLLYDGVGSWGLRHRFVEDLREAGVKTAPFLPISFPMFRREFNYRNHRKIAVVDGQVGFIGGFNIGDKYMGLSKRLSPWRDTMARFTGQAAMGLDNLFRRDWLFAASEELPLHTLCPKPSPPFVQLAQGGPDSPHEDLIKHAYLAVINGSRRRLWITTPYLVPGQEILWALTNASLRGVDVRVVIPSIPDHFTVFWASRYHVRELLESGVRVYLYRRGFIHAKTLIADDSTASVGTVNMDVRSLEINYEAQAFVFDPRAVERLEADFVKDFMDSQEVTFDQWRDRPLGHRLLESSFRLLSPEL
ncbi:phosphatidylserine/phosphatidylglycerophosphate/cardiolipin synthase [Thermanaerovibrio velox DSM 12556]|uniref:Cardiolipin synthase n=1 Tax=Thermanaerovibrio velox DSM 12556 TaxID=926567 RepID=H0UQM6_9BACT|nr:cardiolipin synthase [Thermanaerovibrio velox]EHM10790.1 phosphatidylserine/phosphatidylglycerophosphate/cardiolipin synthase [Thermanaerovibrio velox DSM 12556]